VGCEPHEPIQAIVIRSDEARGAIDVSWLAAEFIIDPERGWGRRGGGGGGVGVRVNKSSLENNFVADLGDGSKGAVGVEDAERVVGSVHDLLRRDEIGDDGKGEVGEQTEQEEVSQIS
jgi:hypothetical protein